ncbi:MAG TPA: hypothetical protein PLA54_03170 [Spirochaetota bacterium]|nr:hypothetical protein [Spirochaetota bacterium]
MKSCKQLSSAGLFLIFLLSSSGCSEEKFTPAEFDPIIKLNAPVKQNQSSFVFDDKASFNIPSGMEPVTGKLLIEAKNAVKKNETEKFQSEIRNVWIDKKENILMVLSVPSYFSQNDDFAISSDIVQNYKDNIAGAKVHRDFNSAESYNILQIAVEIRSIILYKFIIYSPETKMELSFIIQKENFFRNRSHISGIIESVQIQR